MPVGIELCEILDSDSPAASDLFHVKEALTLLRRANGQL
jgi:hypothetical protein